MHEHLEKKMFWASLHSSILSDTMKYGFFTNYGLSFFILIYPHPR